MPPLQMVCCMQWSSRAAFPVQMTQQPPVHVRLVYHVPFIFSKHAEHERKIACSLLTIKQELMRSVCWICVGEGFVTADIDMEERSDDFAAVLKMERAAGHALSLMVRAVRCSARPLLTMKGAT